MDPNAFAKEPGGLAASTPCAAYAGRPRNLRRADEEKHIASLTTVAAEDEEWVRRLLLAVQTVAANLEARDGAAAVVTNLGRYQDSKHLHVHVVSGSPRDT